ncbi:hypothetical protein AXF42_Ash014927 [Apostasia shenzhenica]|uniref:Uncharacterized protein n=1 Tax=Apostasia shenzhenica TaxID=1088818 RepID=A0A2I0ALK1_9ASPA|nr:hypothetical protein AXF42_Ash014927 [Apostasia shenzhenica]
MMFRSRASHYPRAPTAPFLMLGAPASHTNQGPACFSHHRFPKESRRSRSQALVPLFLAPLVANSGGTTSMDSAIEYFILFRKTRTELHYLLSINILWRATEKKGLESQDLSSITLVLRV